MEEEDYEAKAHFASLQGTIQYRTHEASQQLTRLGPRTFATTAPGMKRQLLIDPIPGFGITFNAVWHGHSFKQNIAHNLLKDFCVIAADDATCGL